MLSPEVGFLSLFLKSIPKGGEHALKSEIPWRMEGLLDCYLLILLILALAALTLGGMGSPESVGAVGALLCVVGCIQKKPQADLYAVVPMALYLALVLCALILAMERLPRESYITWAAMVGLRTW